MQTTLTDGRITLRPFSPADAPADAPALLEVARESCEEIGRWMPWSDSVTDLDGAQRFIQERLDERSKGEAHMFAVVDAATGRMLGGCGSGQINRKHDIANVVYWVRSSERGRGIAAATVRLLAPFGFGALGLQRLEIVVEPAKGPGIGVAEKGAPTSTIAVDRAMPAYGRAGRPLDVVISIGRSGPDGSRCRR